MIIWKNKYLGEVPDDENNRALIDKYNSEFRNDSIQYKNYMNRQF